MTLISKPMNGSESSKLSSQLAAEAKINEALSRALLVMNECVSEQKELSAETQIAYSEITSKVDSLIKTLDKYYSKEDKEPEKDTSVADAIKALKFPQTKIDFEPFNRVATQLEQQNKLIAELASKFQASQRGENNSHEPLMREFMSVIANNSNALSLLKPPTPKDDTMLLSTIKEAIGGNKVKEWEFTVQYNANDSIQKITAKPKM